MEDSIKLVDDGYIRRIHTAGSHGKLHKGHNVTAASSSIPSKYQTIVTDNSDRKGFLTRSRRFNLESVNEIPGPGSYMSHGKLENDSPSCSKKGTGGFASKDKRIHKHSSTCSPGSGAYSLPSYIMKKSDFNKAGSTSAFHEPIAQPAEPGKGGNPAPNQYNVLSRSVGKTNNVAANAAFKSQSKRDAFTNKDVNSKPAPWHYHVNEDLLKGSVKVPISVFKSKTRRQMLPDPLPVPGPGTYKPHEDIEPVSKTVFLRKHYLSISAPAMPLPPPLPTPGPGAYHLVNYEGPEKHFMSGSAFVSTTSRWTGDQLQGKTFPGPAHYQPLAPGKQSFIYNAHGKWL